MATDPRFLTDPAVKYSPATNCWSKAPSKTEGGVHLLTGYPGSPVAASSTSWATSKTSSRSNGVRAFQANNEALGAAAVNGSQMAPCRAIARDEKRRRACRLRCAGALGNLAARIPKAGRSSSWAKTRGATARRCRPTAGSSASTCAWPVVEPGDAAGSEGLDRPVASSSRRRRGCTSATSSPPPRPTAAAPSSAGRISFPQINTKQQIALETAQDRSRTRCCCRRARGSRN